jgi:lipoprotein-anchoring transpeptidase ErfK/SrfK
METTGSKSKARHSTGLPAAVLALVFTTGAAGQTPRFEHTVLTRQPHRVVLVSIPDRRLAVLEDGAVRRTFPVAVGAKASPSPTGRFRVVNRYTDPSYSHAGVVVPPGRGNPVGRRWIGLSKKGYGIHGTNQPRSIGQAASHGCIRLNNRDIQELFAIVTVGDTVDIRGERDPEVARIFGASPSGPSGGAQDAATARANQPFVAQAQESTLAGGEGQ